MGLSIKTTRFTTVEAGLGEATTFTSYRDLVDPEVKVSNDGTLGWVICQVEMQGHQGVEEFGAVLAWVEL